MTIFDDLDMWFGDECKDDVTGFKGVVTSINGYIDGCVQVGLTPKIDEKGILRDTCQFDTGRLTVTKKRAVDPQPTPTGGPVGDGATEPVR